MRRDAPRRRRLPLTPLIDVIFLLLLFFMLSSTFTRNGEIALRAAAPGAPAADRPPDLLRLTPDRAELNGRAVQLDALAEAVAARPAPRRVAISPAGGASSQRLVDALAALRRVPDAEITVLAR